MDDFVVIDFETANPKRVSACSLGYVVIRSGSVTEKGEVLINPIGGHAGFQTSIHGIKKEDTAGEPDFGSQYASLSHLFDLPVVGYSTFDKQVLNALSKHFDLGIRFDYVDCCSIARKELPVLKNHRLNTVAKHLQLSPFKHHDALEDATACAEIFLRLRGSEFLDQSDTAEELDSLVTAILEDGMVDYKEACQLLYWLEDNAGESRELNSLKSLVSSSLEKESLSAAESEAIREILERRSTWGITPEKLNPGTPKLEAKPNLDEELERYRSRHYQGPIPTDTGGRGLFFISLVALVVVVGSAFEWLNVWIAIPISLLASYLWLRFVEWWHAFLIFIARSAYLLGLLFVLGRVFDWLNLWIAIPAAILASYLWIRFVKWA